MKILRLLTATTLLLLSATAAMADSDASRHKQAAANLLEAMGLEGTMRESMTAIIDMQLEQNPGLSPYHDVLREWSITYLQWESVEPHMIDLYKETFSEVELREMTRFYLTPTGQKSLEKLPELLRRSAEIGAELATKHLPKLEEMVRKRAEELGHSLEKPED